MVCNLHGTYIAPSHGSMRTKRISKKQFHYLKTYAPSKKTKRHAKRVSVNKSAERHGIALCIPGSCEKNFESTSTIKNKISSSCRIGIVIRKLWILPDPGPSGCEPD